MRRQENPWVQSSAGVSPVPLFSHRKRSRVPLTSAPSDMEFFSRMKDTPDPHQTGVYRYYQSPGPSPSQQYRAAPPVLTPPGLTPPGLTPCGLIPPGPTPPRLTPSGPTHRGLTPRGPTPPEPLTHPDKGGNIRLKWTHQDYKLHKHPFEPRATQSTHKPTQLQRAVTLRILTVTISTMRHWSHFKHQVPVLFELCATLDSAVTLGLHGAKNFLLGDGKEVVQCVYYQNECVLPVLVRGHVHRCVGSYDLSSDLLTCVCVRAGHPSELRNAHQAVTVCDAEMRAVLQGATEL